MTTGYEAKMYSDISRIAKALERIATVLEIRTGFVEGEPPPRPRAKVHKPEPREDGEHCAVCGARIKRIGQGIWVHADSGAVAAPNP